MSEELKTLLFVVLAISIIGGLMRSAWRMLKQSERMLNNIDKTKLRDWDESEDADLKSDRNKAGP